MFARILTIWQWIRTSLWALPLLMVLCAIGTAIVILNVPFEAGGDPVWWLYSGSGKEAPNFLSDLVAAMITMGTLVISITMVVLTLAAQQLGPRLILAFMADRKTQVAIGLFVSTIVYLLLVLRSVYGRGDVPNLAVTTGTVLVLMSVIALPLFVHHLARAIVADTVIARVGRALDASMRALLPAETALEVAPERLRRHTGAMLRLDHGGYIQAIDYGRLIACAKEWNATIELGHRAGQHLIAGAVVARIAPPPRDHERVQKTVNAAVLIGPERTPVQDIEYSLWQLVEVALRALSPGINDPHTAVACIDRLGRSLGLMMRRGPAPQVWRDDEGIVRVIGPASTFEGVVDAAFNEIRQIGCHYPAILIRLAETLSQLAEQATPLHRKVLATHLKLIGETGRRTLDSPYDLETLDDRVARGMDHLEAQSAHTP